MDEHGKGDFMAVDENQFYKACQLMRTENRPKSGIGTLGEKTLHAVLKHYYEPFADNQEVKIGSFVADIVSENGIIEIQTQGFDKLRKKLPQFLEYADVTVVYPLAKQKSLCWIDQETGEVTKKRKSPKQGSIYDVFFELYKIKNMLLHPRIHFCFPLLEITEYRYLNGWSVDKKRGSSRCDRIPERIIEEFRINSIYDYYQMLPKELPENFGTKDYAKYTKLTLRKAQIALNILYSVGCVERVGKRGNAYLYQIKE